MKRYLTFIGAFFLSVIGSYILLIGTMLLVDDARPGFMNDNPPSILMMFITFLVIPSLVAYYVAFELKKSKKTKSFLPKIELEIREGEVDQEVDRVKKESHWLFALVATFIMVGVIMGLLTIFPAGKTYPFTLEEVGENEFFPTSSVPDETINWKTYTSQDYSFKYPPSWVLSISRNSDLLFYLDQESAVRDGPDFIFGVGFSESEWMKISFNDSEGIRKEIGDKIFVSKVQNLTLDRKAAFTWRQEVLAGSQTDARPEVGAYIALGDKILKIEMPIGENINEQILNQILATFRFSGQTPSGLKVDQVGFSKRHFALEEKFFSSYDYPQELSNIKEDELISTRCTPVYSQNGDSYSYYDDVIKKHEFIFDPNLLQIVKEAAKTIPGEAISSFQYCETKQGTNLLNYGVEKAGGGMGNKAYFALVMPDKTLKRVTNIPNSGIPYFGCRKLLQWTILDKIYYECSGGDGGFGAAEIYVFDLMTSATKKVIHCESVANNEESGAVVTCT